jgi:hypothetical protein
MNFRARSFSGSLLVVDSSRAAKNPSSITLDGEPLNTTLRPTVHRLLLYLLANAGRSVRFDELRSHVWANEGASAVVIERTLRELREALGKQWIAITPKTSSCTLSAIADVPDAYCPIYTRKQIDHAIGSIDDRLRGHVEELWISGLDNTYVAIAETAPLLRILDQGAKVRLMGVDPKSRAPAMLDQIDPRTEANSFESQVNKVTEVAREWSKRFPETFEYRLLPVVPALGFFIVDPNRPSQQVKFEIYTARPWNPLGTRPHFVITEQLPEWREYFTTQFENYWELSKVPFE